MAVAAAPRPRPPPLPSARTAPVAPSRARVAPPAPTSRSADAPPSASRGSAAAALDGARPSTTPPWKTEPATAAAGAPVALAGDAIHVSRLRRRLDRVRVRRCVSEGTDGEPARTSSISRRLRALLRARGESHAPRARLHDRREVGRGHARLDPHLCARRCARSVAPPSVSSSSSSARRSIGSRPSSRRPRMRRAVRCSTPIEKQRLLEAYGELVRSCRRPSRSIATRPSARPSSCRRCSSRCPTFARSRSTSFTPLVSRASRSLFDANAHDIAHVAGIPSPLAARIVERVQAYRNELKSSSPQDARAAEREKLAGAQRGAQAAPRGLRGGRQRRGRPTRRRGSAITSARARRPGSRSASCSRASARSIACRASRRCPFAQRITQLTRLPRRGRDKYRAAEA